MSGQRKSAGHELEGNSFSSRCLPQVRHWGLSIVPIFILEVPIQSGKGRLETSFDDRSSAEVWRGDERSSAEVWRGDDRSSDRHFLLNLIAANTAGPSTNQRHRNAGLGPRTNLVLWTGEPVISSLTRVLLNVFMTRSGEI